MWRYVCCARYYEPLAQECSSIQELLQGPAVRKLLFMTNPERIDGLLKPHWGAVLQGQSAELLQAVPNMLEVVPVGVNKWAGLQVRVGACACMSGSGAGGGGGDSWV